MVSTWSNWKSSRNREERRTAQSPGSAFCGMSLCTPSFVEPNEIHESCRDGIGLADITSVERIGVGEPILEAFYARQGNRQHCGSAGLGEIHAVGNEWCILAADVSAAARLLLREVPDNHEMVRTIARADDVVELVGHRHLVTEIQLPVGVVVVPIKSHVSPDRVGRRSI